MKRSILYIALAAMLSGGCTPSGVVAPLTSSPSLGTVTGVLVGLDGKPAGNVPIKAYVAASPSASAYRVQDASGSAAVATGTTSSDGSFTLANVPTGKITVEADQSDNAKALALQVAVVAGTKVNLGNFSLKQTGAISGKVAGPSNLLGLDVFIPGTNFDAKTDASGNFTILYVPEGTFDLVAMAPKYKTVTDSGVQVKGGQSVAAPQFNLVLAAPVITSIGPQAFGYPNQTETINGSGFGASSNSVLQVTLNGAILSNVVRKSDSQITVPISSSGNIVVTSDGVPSNSYHYVVAAQIVISPSGLVMFQGQKQKFTAVLEDTDGNPLPVKLTWGIVDSSYLGETPPATIDADGGLTANEVGSLQIWAEAGNGVVENNPTIQIVAPGVPSSTAPNINIVAGNGIANPGDWATYGDGGPAAMSTLNRPWGVAVDGNGNLYIADMLNNRIRKVDANGLITTVAGTGTGTKSYSGDGGPATSANLNQPHGVAVDTSGNLFIADTNNNCVRKVSTSGIITTVAGTGYPGFSGDGGAATSAQLDEPYGVAVDGNGNLYIADNQNNRIRVVSPLGVINTLAGTGTNGYSGDGGAAVAAGLSHPEGVAVDSLGNLYIADYGDSRVRKVDANHIITTVAGNGSYGFSGDGGSAINAGLEPSGVAVDTSGNLYITDYLNNRVRKVDTNNIITTLAGNGTGGYGGDEGAAASAELYNPSTVAVDSSGNVYIADYGNNKVRKVH